MKRTSIYILLFVLLAVVLLLVLSNSGGSAERRLDERVTFRKQDKLPYGTYAAYQNLAHIFPGVPVLSDKKRPGYWDSLGLFEENQVLLIISPQFYPDETEMGKLLRFAKSGNTIFISTQQLSYDAQEALNCTLTDRTMPTTGTDDERDRLSVKLSGPPFYENESYSYPGKKEIFWFYNYDTAVSQVMGIHSNGFPNFLRLRTGKGQIFLQVSPFTFTNYFLLHKNNMNYYDRVLSAIKPDGVSKVLWDEYFLDKKYIAGDYFNTGSNNTNGKSWFSTLMSYPSFRNAFWVLLLLLIGYVLIEMRRRQRYIPVISKPKNDSLDFVKTVGRLYHQKSDHKNLLHKMTAYCLEYIRAQYKLPTNRLDEDFIVALQHKSGYPEKELRYLVNFMNSFSNLPAVSDSQLADFHRRLEHFYKHA